MISGIPPQPLTTEVGYLRLDLFSRDFEPVKTGLDRLLGETSALTTRVDVVFNWARSNSLMPLPMGLSCCGIEMMSSFCPGYDMGRFGSESFRFSPRQADVLFVAGWCSYKISHVLRRIWDQMADPKWCIAMGACASSGGMHRCYGVVQGVDNFLPVDVYIPGCPPRPEALQHALMDIQEMIRNEYTVTLDYASGRGPG